MIGIPLKVLYECQGHNVTVELTTNELYRGRVTNVEDSMNVSLADVTCVAKDGQTSYKERIFIRGSQIRFVAVPTMLSCSPHFHGQTQKGHQRPPGSGITKQQAQQQHQTQRR
ncbi:small nuclear ribonucleoprotein Sm D3 [Carpediemonas membranifera]|uniref:Small nuclear ribonucleoprotein Sm D3 n=1 Tax=Carpediemonas membranifera TaxID=201153 RepID=A0A8J6B5U3_9EUKA|nr:small nuclear ribonucleoprotein Sm D3 [Carpediemonas membranifera]|eukprot:KAG9396288.1 small nuclear ribonucleoprotein Sm D3 [Carpediemonas membranifera]